MQIEHMKGSLVVGWVLILGAIGASLNVGSATGWLLVVGVGLLPAMVLFHIWRQPTPTMSESIREVLK